MPIILVPPKTGTYYLPLVQCFRPQPVYTKPVPSIYGLKPKFQALLRPIARGLATAGVRANHVTSLACLLSVGLGTLLTVRSEDRRLLLILPAFLFVRMALNAIDGMLAREFGQKSNLGAYLNELTDVISDAFLYLPFAYLAPFEPVWIGAIIWLAAVSEMAGTVGVMVGGGRRYDGPMGKSDRAFFFGALGLVMGLGVEIPALVAFLFDRLIALGLVVTIVNRVRNGLAATRG